MSDAAREAVEKTAIAGWLRRETNANHVGITRYERLSGGAIQDNRLLDVDIDGGACSGQHHFVLRTDAPTRVPMSLTRAQEFAVLRVAHAAGVIAPEPVFLCRDTHVLGREFFIMQRVAGVAQGYRLTRERTLVPDGDALVRALSTDLARLHAIRPPCPQLGFPPPPVNPARASIAEYRGHLDRLDDPYPALEWGLRWCERNAPATLDITLTHRDYRTGNYLVDGGKLTGVLDWEFAGWGDPREDLGWFTARCWRFSGVDLEAGGIAPTGAVPARLRIVDGAVGLARRTRLLAGHGTLALGRHRATAGAATHTAGGERSLELALTGRIVHELEYELLRVIAKGCA